jgi:hypothetical protein
MDESMVKRSSQARVTSADRSPSPSDGTGISRRAVVGMLLGSATFAAVGTLSAPTASAAPRDRAAQPQALTEALRWLDKPGVEFTTLGVVQNRRYRVTFHLAQWDGGQSIVRDVELKVGRAWLPVTDLDRRFDEQWVVLTAPQGALQADHWSTLQRHWVGFTGFRQLNDKVVELVAELPEVATLVVRWDLRRDHPELHQQLTARRDDSFMVGYSGLDAVSIGDVDEVLCGARQHAKFVQPSSEPLGAWELFAPMSLTQRTLADIGVTTLGLFVPSDALEFVHERNEGAGNQAFGMSLRSDFGDVAPSSFFPHFGQQTPMQSGESKGFITGLYVSPSDLETAYADLARSEYGYAAYRRNVFESSLTDAAHNLAELMMVDPDGDDSETFVPSWSGWWNRAKGIIDVENDQAVRISGAAIALMAHRILGTDLSMYRSRALPMLEYQVSRRGVGSTPIEGKAVYGDRTKFRVAGVAVGGVALNALYQLTGRTCAALPRLAAETVAADLTKYASSPSMYQLAMWKLTGDRSYLVEAQLRARRYVTDNITKPYETQGGDVSFAFSYAKRWTDLQRLYEVTGDDHVVDGVHREARRFVTEALVRPVPGGTITVPDGKDLGIQHNWPGGALPDYPDTEIPATTVPKWQVSPTGMVVEQLSTYKHMGGYTNNACWSPFLLRLAHHTDDPLLSDVAHNQVIGRFTNFPGYYNVQFQVHQQRPDFPYIGPIHISGFWYHHIPGQLALAINHLFGDAYYRSGGKIDFPRDFEASHAYFDWDLIGHEPGTFYGEDGVWPYFPKGLVTLDNPQINWLAGVGNGHTYLSLSNVDDRPQRVTVTLGSLLGSSGRTLEVDNLGKSPVGRIVVRNDSFTVIVPKNGLVAVAIRGVTVEQPWHIAPGLPQRGTGAYHTSDLDPGGEEGVERGMLVVRPDQSGYDAYIQVDTTQQAVLHYRVGDGDEQVIDDKPYPNEWTIGVDDLTAPFHYTVTTPTWGSEETTLQVPTSIATSRLGVAVELHGQASSVVGGESEVALWILNGTDDRLDSFAVDLLVPDGWVLSLGEVPTSLEPGAEHQIEGTLTVPADAALASHELTGTSTWDGGSTEVASLPIAVRDPRSIISFTAEPAVITEPGGTATLRVVVINAADVPLTGQLKAWSQPGWSVIGDGSVTLSPESETVHEFQVRAPATAAPGFNALCRVELDNDSTMATTVSIAQPLHLVEISSPSTRSWGADDPVVLTTMLVNHGESPVSGTTVITPPSGWSVDLDTIEWTIDDGGRQPIAVTLTPTSAAPGSRGTITIAPGGGLANRTVAVSVANPVDQVILPDEEGYTERGTWLPSGLKGVDGSGSLYSPDGVYGGQVEWRGDIVEAGTYEVSVWYPTNPTTTSDASYVVHVGQAEEEHHVSQQDSAGAWRVLGTYECEVGDLAAVVITAISGLHTRVNAARFRKM